MFEILYMYQRLKFDAHYRFHSSYIESNHGILLQDLAEEAGTSVNGGQTMLNPWITIGGVATTVCQSNEFIM